MDFVPELLKQGALGLIAAIFLWLYIQERKDRKELQKEKDTLMEARRNDAAENNKLVNSLIPGVTAALDNLVNKIESTKGSST